LSFDIEHRVSYRDRVRDVTLPNVLLSLYIAQHDERKTTRGDPPCNVSRQQVHSPRVRLHASFNETVRYTPRVNLSQVKVN